MKKKILAALTAGILTTGLMTGTVVSSPYRGNFNNRPYDRNCFCGGHRSER